MVEVEVEMGMEWDNYKNFNLLTFCDIFSGLDTFFLYFLCFVTIFLTKKC